MFRKQLEHIDPSVACFVYPESFYLILKDNAKPEIVMLMPDQRRLSFFSTPFHFITPDQVQHIYNSIAEGLTQLFDLGFYQFELSLDNMMFREVLQTKSIYPNGSKDDMLLLSPSKRSRNSRYQVVFIDCDSFLRVPSHKDAVQNQLNLQNQIRVSRIYCLKYLKEEATQQESLKLINGLLVGLGAA